MCDDRQPYTSERVSVDHYQSDPADYLVYCMHVATYDFARAFVRDAEVLDFGCGTGYGAKILSAHADSIVGVDISGEAIAEARTPPVPDNVTFEVMAPIEQEPLPHDDDTFDVVLSFQVIEHVPDVDVYLREIRRVLRPGGRFVCATPDRTVRLHPRQRPWNVFHLDEFSPQQMDAMMRSAFGEVDVYGMTSTPSEILAPELDRYRTMRWITLPFTFPGAPERWRRWGLTMMQRAKHAARRRPARVQSRTEHGFTPEHIQVETDIRGTPNVITVAR